MPAKKPVLLLILDGWGHAAESYPVEMDAIRSSHVPYWNSLLADWPHTLIETSGNAVGLPKGIMGNSEVGHLNLGAGRVVWQQIARIDKDIEEDGLASNAAFTVAINTARDSHARLHLMGLVSDAGVHSMDSHYYAILRLAKKLGLPSSRVFFHCFLDGRDTPPRSGLGFVRQLEETMRNEDLGRIATVGGRYWGMDRDKRWDRVKRAYDAMMLGQSEVTATSGVEAVEKGYARDENDEFVQPTVILGSDGKPVGTIRSNDQAVFFNFRPDRARQLSHALVDTDFQGFDRGNARCVTLTTMTSYEAGLAATVAFPPRAVTDPLGAVVSKAGMTQLRIAETEKYAHVTYFFSGGHEQEYPGEDRVLVPSPKVATYDLQPEMSLPEVSEKLAAAIRSGKYDLIVSNFANGDMVGHTGILAAARKAAEAVDKALSLVIPAVLEMGGSAIVTADHGNCENEWNFDENCANTQHTTMPTPCVLVSERFRTAKLREGGCLGDVAPTLIELMGGLEAPVEMTGKSLIVH